ncbi:ankyrin repeat protein [Trichoderma ceciliae]
MSGYQQNDVDNSAYNRAGTEVEGVTLLEDHHVVEYGTEGDDGESTVISELSDATTSRLLSISSRSETEGTRPLGLSRAWGISSFDDYDVITVHGLRDDHSTAWKSKNGESWLRSQLFESLSIRQLDFFYAVDESARVFQEDGIKIEAKNLLQEYCAKRRELPDTEIYRPIIWVCHDIGGTIVKQVLIEATQATTAEGYHDVETWEYMKEARRRIATCSTIIIFLGCPHRAESRDSLEDELHNLMILPGPEIKKGILRKIKSIAHQVSKTNFQFLETNLFSRFTKINIFHLQVLHKQNLEPKSNKKSAPSPNQSVNVYRDDPGASKERGRNSAKDSPPTFNIEYVPELALPFSRYSISLTGTFDIADRYRSDAIDHLELVRGEENSEYKWATWYSNRFTQKYYSLKISTDLLHCQVALLSLMPPRKTPKVHMDTSIKENQNLPFLTWITSQDAYKGFYDSHGPRILHIECAVEDAWRAAMFSQYFYILYESSTEYVTNNYERPSFYFEFDKFDVRYNSIKSMLVTFICEMTWRFWHSSADSPTIRRLFKSLQYYHCWSLADIFKLFTEVRKCPSVVKFTLILSCWENCLEEERTWFLTRVLEQHRRSDLCYRLVITTSGADDFLNNSIPSSQMLSLENCPTLPQGYVIDEKDTCNASGLESSLEDVLQQRPALEDAKPYLGYIILDWLDHFGRGLRPVTSDSVLSELARVIYRWVRFAMEPLTIEELGHAVTASTASDYMPLLDIDYERLLEDLKRLFCGIIKVEGREIRFSHDSFYTSTLSGLNDSNSEQPASAHAELAEACLKYLLQDEVQQRYSKFSVENRGGDVDKCLLMLPRDDLLDYAVRLWSTHYRLSGRHRPLELALRFLRTKAARSKWAEAHYLLSNPFTRCQRSFISVLPLMAALGLEDVVSKQIEEEQNSQWFQQDGWLAITEAARNGHIDIVRKLMDYVQVEESGLQEAIFWATYSGNEEIMAELLSKVASLDRFSFPKSILSRAAASGLYDLVLAMKEAKYNLAEVNSDLGDETALHTALLLDAGVDPATRDDQHDEEQLGLLLMNTAITAGEWAALECLLLAGADCKAGESEAEFDELRCPIIHAASCGRSECIRVLLENGADPRTESKDGSPLYILCGEMQAIDSYRALLEKGADPNQCYSDKEMLLSRALKTNDRRLINLLIEEGARLDTLDTFEGADDRTPLLVATVSCSIETLEYLLEKGADVNYAPEGLMSALFGIALRCCDVKMAELLLDRGADIHLKRSDGCTPLHLVYDIPEIVNLFLKHGADMNTMSYYGNLLMMAARWNFADTLKILLSEKSPLTDINAKFTWDEDDENHGNTALGFAVKYKNYECANLLLEAGAQIDATFEDAKLVIRSTKDNNAEGALRLMRYFLQHGIKADHVDEGGKTALHEINKETPASLIQLLLDSGCHVDTPNNNGWTPLALAVECGNVAAAKHLISRGAKANVFGPEFSSLLHLALKDTSRDQDEIIEMMKILIEAKADPSIPSNEPARESLLHTLIRDFRDGALHKLSRYLIQDVHVDVNAQSGLGVYPILAAASIYERRIVEYLIRHGANFNVADDQGRRVLHHVVTLGQKERLIRVLANAGADMQAPDNFGRTPLHLVAGYGYKPVMEALLKRLPKGFNINIRDADGWTPLMWACRLDESNGGVVKSLVNDYNADIWARSTDGEWSALKLACFSEMTTDVQEILQPSEGKRERICEGGIKQSWDAALHYKPPGTLHSNWYCDSCLVCFPYRIKIHNAEHEFREYGELKNTDGDGTTNTIEHNQDGNPDRIGNEVADADTKSDDGDENDSEDDDDDGEEEEEEE